MRNLVKVLRVNWVQKGTYTSYCAKIATKWRSITKNWQFDRFFTYVAKLNLNENGTFPSKVVSKPSRGKTKENLIVNVQSLVILGIKKRRCRDNNRESDSKSIKDWYASDETNKAVNTKKDEHLNHMTEYDLLIDQGSNGLTFIYMICNVLIHPYASLFFQEFFRSRKRKSIPKNCKEKFGFLVSISCVFQWTSDLSPSEE